MIKIRIRTTPANKASNDTTYQDTSRRIYINNHNAMNDDIEFNNCHPALRFEGISNAFTCCRSSAAVTFSYEIVLFTGINKFLT